MVIFVVVSGFAASAFLFVLARRIILKTATDAGFFKGMFLCALSVSMLICSLVLLTAPSETGQSPDAIHQADNDPAAPELRGVVPGFGNPALGM